MSCNDAGMLSGAWPWEGVRYRFNWECLGGERDVVLGVPDHHDGGLGRGWSELHPEKYIILSSTTSTRNIIDS